MTIAATTATILFLILIISTSFIGFMSLAKVMNPIQIYLGITDIVSVSYEYIMLQATVNLYNTKYLNCGYIYLNCGDHERLYFASTSNSAISIHCRINIFNHPWLTIEHDCN